MKKNESLVKKRVNSRAKGARGEREAAKVIAAVLGLSARRGQQFAGGADSPDVVTDANDIHFEIKRVENLNIVNAVKQAVRDAGESKTPVVLHRRNNCDWLLTLRFADVPSLVAKLSKYLDLQK